MVRYAQNLLTAVVLDVKQCLRGAERDFEFQNSTSSAVDTNVMDIEL